MARQGTAIAMGALLLLLAAGSAEAQATATMRIPTKYADPPKTGVLRLLVCRGRPGLHLTRRDSSSTGDVAVTLAYNRNPRPSGDNYQHLEAGACSWNPGGDSSLPPEPGQVHFSLVREGSAWVADPRTLTIWLNDPQHYWVFFVDDVTNTSISHGPFRDRFWAGTPRRARPAPPMRPACCEPSSFVAGAETGLGSAAARMPVTISWR